MTKHAFGLADQLGGTVSCTPVIGVVFVIGPAFFIMYLYGDDSSAAVSNGCHVSFIVNFSRSERISDGQAWFFNLRGFLKLPYYSMLKHLTGCSGSSVLSSTYIWIQFHFMDSVSFLLTFGTCYNKFVSLFLFPTSLWYETRMSLIPSSFCVIS